MLRSWAMTDAPQPSVTSTFHARPRATAPAPELRGGELLHEFAELGKSVGLGLAMVGALALEHTGNALMRAGITMVIVSSRAAQRILAINDAREVSEPAAASVDHDGDRDGAMVH